jgi:hypothetical protein
VRRLAAALQNSTIAQPRRYLQFTSAQERKQASALQG